MIQLDNLKQQIANAKNINHLLAACNQDADVAGENWEFATLASEQVLDTFMRQLAALNKNTAIRIASILARYAFEYVRTNHRDDIAQIGLAFYASDPCMDGAPIEKQIMNVEKWLADPSPVNEQLVSQGIDPSRQMNIWEEDLFPADDQMWGWIMETAQLLSMAVVANDADADDEEDSPYGWSSAACVSRSALCSFKAIAQAKRTPDQDLAKLFNQVAKEL